MATTTLPFRPTTDAKVTWLVSFGHFFAHLNILVLAPLFPVLKDALGVSYAQLGLAISLLNIVTLVTQAPVGAMVDRLGAAPILITGHMLFAAAIALTGLVPGYLALMALMVVAGLGNAVYHPADYAILSVAVPRERAGRAFGIHTFGGYLGFAAAPVLSVGLSELVGWRWALGIIGTAGIALGFVLVANRHLLTSHGAAPAGTAATRAQKAEPGGPSARALLFTPAILLSLLFFCLLAMSQGGFSLAVPALTQLHGMSLVEASLPLTLYLVGNAAGVLMGGWAADRTDRHERVVAACFLLTALFAALLAALHLPAWGVIALFLAAGIASGFVSPSRDMLVKKVTPAGASGRVFGFVTLGLNIGGFLGPPIFGHVVDIGQPALLFWITAGLSLLTLVAVLRTADAGRAHLGRT